MTRPTADLVAEARATLVMVGRSPALLDSAVESVRLAWQRENGATFAAGATDADPPSRVRVGGFALAERALRRSCEATLDDPGDAARGARKVGGCRCVRADTTGTCPCTTPDCYRGWTEDSEGRARPCGTCRGEVAGLLAGCRGDRQEFQHALRSRSDHARRKDADKQDRAADRPAW